MVEISAMRELGRLVVLILAGLAAGGCNRERADGADQRPAPSGSGTAAPPAANVAPADAVAPTPAVLPTPSQAETAARTWMTALGRKQPGRLVAASAFPFRFKDGVHHDACGEGVTPDAAALRKAAVCFGREEGMRDASEIEVSSAGPALPPIVAHHDWTQVFPPEWTRDHVFVNTVNVHPRYPANVIYGLLAVRMSDQSAKVDGALFVFSLEGD